jgi:hypothetical protein
MIGLLHGLSVLPRKVNKKNQNTNTKNGIKMEFSSIGKK